MVDGKGWDRFVGIFTACVVVSSVFSWPTLGCTPKGGSTLVSGGVSGAGELPDEDDLGLEGSKSGQMAWCAE